MDSSQENKYSMCLASTAYLDGNDSVISIFPGYAKVRTELGLNLTGTGIIIKKLTMGTSGIGMNKSALLDLAVGKGLDLSRKLVALAKVTKNIDLEKKVKLTSAVYNMPDAVLKEKLEGILDIGNEYKTEAGPYGVTDSLLEDVRTAISAYFEAIPKPRLNITERKELNKELKDNQKAADGLFDVIDALMNSIRETSPVVCQGYFNARKLVNSGQRHLSMKVQVNNAATGLGEQGVVIEIAEQAGDEKEAGSELTKTVKRTGASGGVTAKGLNDGTYTVTAKKPGFVTQTITVYVSAGEITRVVIELVTIQQLN